MGQVKNSMSWQEHAEEAVILMERAKKEPYVSPITSWCQRQANLHIKLATLLQKDDNDFYVNERIAQQ